MAARSAATEDAVVAGSRRPGGDEPNPALVRTAGRPRDAEIDERLLRAAVDLYLEHGLIGFNLGAVARRANVGKPALYRRWRTREELLLAALEHGLGVDSELAFDFDAGSVRADLIRLAVTSFKWSMSDAGAALLRLQAEQRFNSELTGAAWVRLVRRQAAASREIIQRAIARGELPPDVDGNMLLEAVGGAVLFRVMDTSWKSRGKLVNIVDDYAESIVDFVLGGVLLTYQWDPRRVAGPEQK